MARTADPTGWPSNWVKAFGLFCALGLPLTALAVLHGNLSREPLCP
jgi:hypothetical protein